jgi:predicted nucleic acid-binding protein
LLKHARRFITDAQHEVDMEASLTTAAIYGITGYDAQYVALAESLSTPLITEDRKLRQAVPGIAISMQEFMEHT